MDRRKIKQPKWMRNVVVGSVLKERLSGRLRVVRAVSWRQNGELASVSLLIAHPSWTGRCWTSLSDTDIRLRLKPTRLPPRKLDTDFDKLVVKAMTMTNGSFESRPFTLSAHDVMGIP